MHVRRASPKASHHVLGTEVAAFRASGFSRYSLFTGQSFILLGLYFAASAAASLGGLDDAQCTGGTAAAALAAVFNVCYPVHLLISFMTFSSGKRRKQRGFALCVVGQSGRA